MHAADGAPMLRKRPALSASRKSAPPRAADLAVMPVPMAAPNRKCPRANVAARFVYGRAPRDRTGLFLVDLAIACIRVALESALYACGETFLPNFTHRADRDRLRGYPPTAML